MVKAGLPGILSTQLKIALLLNVISYEMTQVYSRQVSVQSCWRQ